MSGNLWMFSDMLDDEDIEMQKHDFITLYQGADYYGLGLKSFTRMAREAGAVYKIGKKVLIRRTIFDEYLRKIYKKEMEQKALDDAEKTLVMRQGAMVTDKESGRMDIRFGLMDYYGGLHCGECLDVLIDGEWIHTRIEMGDGSDSENLSRMIALYSRQLLTECAEESENTPPKNRVALFDPYILRAYFSHSNCKNCIYDCKA